MVSKLAAVGGVALAVYAAYYVGEPKYKEYVACPTGDVLTRRSNRRADPAKRVKGASWTYKLGDQQRTGATDRIGPRDLSKGLRWSWSTPIVVYNAPLLDEDGNIYIATTVGTVYSLDTDGEKRWEFRAHAQQLANPVIYNQTLYTNDDRGVAYAVSIADGTQRWNTRLFARGSPGNNAIIAGYGLAVFHACLDLTKGLGQENEFVAVDSATGSELWRSRADQLYFNVMMAFADEGKSLVYTDMDAGIFKMETSTGKSIWGIPGYPFRRTRDEGWLEDSPDGTPRSHGALALVDQVANRVYSSGNPTKTSGRLQGHRLDTGEVVWTTGLAYMVGNAAALQVIDGVKTLVVGSGIPCLHPMIESSPPFLGVVYGLEADTGRIRWTYEVEPWFGLVAAGSILHPRCQTLNLPDAFSAPAIDGNGTVYIGWHGGIIYALDGRDGSLISRYSGVEGAQSSPAIGPSGELIATAMLTTYSFWHEN